MLLVRSLRIAFIALLALHLTSAFAAIALLGRMRPALQRIIERNIASLAYVEEMLTVVAARATEPAPSETDKRFYDALLAAENNITEDDEPRVLATIREHAEPALAGDTGAGTALAVALRELGNVNRAAIEKANRDAQRLANAGAWAVVFLSFVTLGTGLIALRQLDKRVLAPLSELHDVLVHTREGDALRRCRPALGAAEELADAMRALNELSDELGERRAQRRPRENGADLDRATLLWMLDQQKAATVVIDGSGEIVAANTLALDRLANEEGGRLRGRLRAVAISDSRSDDITVVAITDQRFLCTLDA